MTVEAEIAAGAPAMNGSSGIEPHSRKARNVVSAARAGERVIGGSPCSSVIIVSIQRSRVPVMTSTALSSASPEKPLASKIWRISSRSPSGANSTCRSSMRRTCSYSSISALVPK
jgi:hypothetical protein